MYVLSSCLEVQAFYDHGTDMMYRQPGQFILLAAWSRSRIKSKVSLLLYCLSSQSPALLTFWIGTRNLLDLALLRPEARFFFCSSIASVLGGSAARSVVTEEWSDDPATASPIGYSQSKWVTEQVCRRAGTGRATVLRIGQLCGDVRDGDGYWNEKEGWPLMIRTAQTTGCLPLLDEVWTSSSDSAGRRISYTGVLTS